MKDVPDMMAQCYHFVHEKIENSDSELIVILLEEYKLMLDISTIWLIHRYHRYTPDELVDIDMAGPRMDDSGPVFHLQWKPPKLYGITSTQGDVKYGKKSSVQHKPKEWLQPKSNMKPPPKSWFGDEYALPTTEFRLNTGDFAKSKNTLWLADSGASCHMTNDMDGMLDCRWIKVPIKIGNGLSMMATHVGSKRMNIISKTGYNRSSITWGEVFTNPLGKPIQFDPSFTITMDVIEWRFKFCSTSRKIVFDKIIKTSNGHANGIDMVPVMNVASVAWTKPAQMEINKFHRSMGHVNEDYPKGKWGNTMELSYMARWNHASRVHLPRSSRSMFGKWL
jgi:hypothetical protein